MPAAQALSRAIAMRGMGYDSAYAAASQFDRAIATWQPGLRSADAEIIRDNARARARARDLYRNHPYAKQIVRLAALAVVGRKLRYSTRVDHVFLGIDEEEADRWGAEFDRVWEMYAHGEGAWMDARRQLNFSQMMRLAVKARIVDGEVLMTGEWRQNGGKWRSAFQLVDVDRLSNPHGKSDTDTLRSGVALDEHSAPIGYYIRNRHPVDLGIDANASQFSWTYVPRETQWGRFVAGLSFISERAEQHRGITDFTTVMRAMKQEQEYSEADLASAMMQAMYAMVIKSSMNYEKIAEVMGAEIEVDENGNAIDPYKAAVLDQLATAAAYHSEAKIRGFDGGRVPHLVPGEELQMVTPGNKGSNAVEFTRASVKKFSAGLGADPISVSQDYSDVNYSSARMSVASNWRGHEVTRDDLVYDIGMPMVRGFLEELFHSKALALPRGVAPADFYDALPALARGRFMASGPPMLDPEKERRGQLQGWNIGLDTIEQMAAEEGDDWRELLRQKAKEIAEMRRLGVPLPGEPILPPTAPQPSQSTENRA